MKNKKIETSSGFVWYSLRISFWLMVLASLLAYYEYPIEYLSLILAIIWYTSTIFTFIVSIVHLFKYEKKIFAIISLTISGIQVILALVLLHYFFTKPIII